VKSLARYLGIPTPLLHEFLLLIRARNTLVHLRPSFLDLDNRGLSNVPDNIVGELLERRIITAKPQVQETLMYTLRREEVGLWSAKLAWRFIDAIISHLSQVRPQDLSYWETIKRNCSLGLAEAPRVR
jgi:hypothetical protein